MRSLTLLLAWAMVLTVDCPMAKLNRELTEMTEARSDVRGSLVGEWNPEQFVVLALFEHEGDEHRQTRSEVEFNRYSRGELTTLDDWLQWPANSRFPFRSARPRYSASTKTT